MEEEYRIRRKFEREKLPESLLLTTLDKLWGKVTLYNVYQLFVQLTSKKKPNPKGEFDKNYKLHIQVTKGEDPKPEMSPFYNSETGELMDEYEIEELAERYALMSEVWEGKPECDLLSIYFNATKGLPKNIIRELVGDADNSLRAIAGADKMLSSVFGIAITAMSFYTDPTISMLTSGTPSQNVDLAGLSFPRRIGVRFSNSYIKSKNLKGKQAIWRAYSDSSFSTPLGKDFYHEDLVSVFGWTTALFKGIFENEESYIKLEIRNPNTELLISTFYFKFKKTYVTSLDGRTYIKHPILDEKIVKDGVLIELCKKVEKDGTVRFIPAKSTFKDERVTGILSPSPEKTLVRSHIIVDKLAKYSEKQKMIFVITPPHLMKYAKIILILIKQLVDINFDQSYLGKPNQKPLYNTRYIIDELGNLQSDGHGISNFATMLSIGLGQGQLFTLVLQVMQQLKDVYGVMIMSDRVAACL